MKANELKVGLREEIGKGPARRYRAAGLLPGILYGPELDTRHITISEKDIAKIFRDAKSNNILLDVYLDGNGDKPYKALVKQVQREPVDGSIVHIDLLQVALDKKLEINIPIKIVGTPVGVKSQGGVLAIVRREIMVSCLPTDIDDFIEVDVTNLEIGDTIHAGDLEMEKYEVLTEPQRTMVTVSAPTIVKAVVEEEEAEEGEEGEEGEGAEAAEEGEEQKEPEVIKQKDKQE